MANKDLRMTAIFCVRDQLSPVIKKLSKSWKGFQDVLNSDNFKKLNNQFGKFRRSLSNVTSQFQSAASKLALSLTAAAGAVGFSLSQMMSKFLSVGDSIDKASMRLGVPVEKLQNLRYAAQMSGGSVEVMDKSLAKFNENIAKAASGNNKDLADLMKKLGISLKDANGNLRNAADILPEFAEGIKRHKDAGLRARMAIAAFGEEGQRLIPMLEGGAEGLAGMEKRAKELGIAMSATDVKAAADLGDRFSELGMVFDSFGNTLSAKIAPILSPIINDLTEFIAQNKEAFSTRISQAVETFANALKKVDFKKVAVTCSNALDAVGRFFDAIGGFETVLKVVAGLFALKLVSGVMGFVGSLATLGGSFASLIPLLAKVGIAFATSLGPVGVIIAAVAAGVGLIIANWDTIGPYFAQLWDSVCSIFSDAWEGVKNLFSNAGDIASEICDAFLNYFADFNPFNLLPDSLKSVGSKMIGEAGGIVSNIGKSFKDFFSTFSLSDMLPESFKNGLNWISEKLGFGGEKEETNPSGMAPVPSSSAYSAMPVAGSESKVDGTIKVEVTAANGASAKVTDTETRGSDLQIQGNVGYSPRVSLGADA
ncbi:hypothetical protein [Turicimonas muris]|uniref:hypothetical protein n=1 Tax=Turicimonas muris TaxID=1796652 RepID=UPI00263AC6DE|nr:hypothetical protein [Turicimonas muris]